MVKTNPWQKILQSLAVVAYLYPVCENKLFRSKILPIMDILIALIRMMVKTKEK